MEMQSKTKFTIILPTRERATTLNWALKTCVAQDYENLDILVSDNFSQDNTKEVVSSYNDSRIKYINTGKRISMSHNWEFALAHVTDGYVFFLGDDDGILPNALTEIDKIIQETGMKVVTWKSEEYLWPDFYNTNRSGLLKITLSNKTHRYNGQKELSKTLNCEKRYEELPFLYKGFISVDIIDAVKKITGNFFHSQIPDLYSAIVLANFVDTYIYSERPYSLAGVSKNSNGASFSTFTSKEAVDKALFTQEENIPFYEDLVFVHSDYIFLAECFLQSFKVGLNKEEEKIFSLLPFLKATIKETEFFSTERREFVLSAITATARKNNLESDVLEIIRTTKHTPRSPKFNYNVYGYNCIKNRIELGDVKNVYEACVLHNEVRNNPQKYFSPSSFLQSTFNFGMREIGKRAANFL